MRMVIDEDGESCLAVQSCANVRVKEVNLI